MKHVVMAVAVASAITLGACGGADKEPPADVVKAFAGAVKAGDEAKACELLSRAGEETIYKVAVLGLRDRRCLGCRAALVRRGDIRGHR